MVLICENNVTNSVVLVTGGTRGIGLSIAKFLVSAGNTVVITGTKTEETLQAASLISNENEGTCHGIQYEQGEPDAARKLIESVKEIAGSLDGLVANAGVHSAAPIGMISTQDIQNLFKTNVIGAIELVQMSSRLLRRSSNPSIVVTTSLMATNGAAGQSVYSSTKAALNGFIRPASKEFGKSGIRINAVAPGYIETDMSSTLSETQRSEIIADTPLSRIGTPEDVTHLVAFLLSPASGFISGQIIGVDGGFTG